MYDENRILLTLSQLREDDGTVESHRKATDRKVAWIAEGVEEPSRAGDHDYNLRSSLSNLMAERRKKVSDDGGERRLIRAPSAASINSQPTSAVSTAAQSPCQFSSSSAATNTSNTSNTNTNTNTGDLERAARKQFQRDVTPAFVYVLAVFSALGGFLCGYDAGVISGAMLLLKRRMRLSAAWQEAIVSSAVAAAALSALLGGCVLRGACGRRASVLLASVAFAVGGVVSSVAPSKEVLLAGRLVVGVGLGKKNRWFVVVVSKST
ncbi:hypothetical protein CRUP_033009 [Coryphaenoides rupestris]|nr:hypothetical protein CRUP_033009 [Coryphaenoides rupestris]